ncbi:MAG: hypothetical protein ABSG31_02235 [Tepidisphaeraceae bacterium]
MKTCSIGGMTFACALLTMFLSTQVVHADAATQPAADSSNAALQQKVQTLEARVEKLESNESANPSPISSAPTTNPSANNPGIRTEFLADEQEPQEAMSGYNPSVGFVLTSPDGKFTFHPGMVIDFRNMTDYRTQIPKGGGGEVDHTGFDTQNGFDITRFRIIFSGQYTPEFTYYVQFQDDQGQGFGLLDAYGSYHFDDTPFSLKAGQWKDPVWHERNLSEAVQMAVDRSLVEDLLGGGQTGRIQGVGLVYDEGRLRSQTVIHDGYDSINTKFFASGGIGAGVGDGAGVTPDNFGVSERADFLAVGDRTDDYNPFTQYDNGFSALGVKETYLVIGAGADYSQAGANSVLFHSVDAQFDMPSGFSAFAAYLASYRALPTNQGIAPGHYYDSGFELQLAQLIGRKFEPFVRYDYSYLAAKTVPGLTDRAEEFTVGGNCYIYRQNLKFTLDGSWLPEGVPTDVDALGELKDSGHTELVVRAQIQLAI